MVLLNVRVSPKLLGLLKHVAEAHDVNASVVVREALQTYLEAPKQGLERVSREAEIGRLVKQLDFLDRTQRKMLRSGAFLGRNLPKDWPTAKKWAVGVSGSEKEALERLLGEREHLSKQIAKLVKETYKRKAQIVLIDRSPWYKLENSAEAELAS
jgi:predicted transcriptional regulator